MYEDGAMKLARTHLRAIRYRLGKAAKLGGLNRVREATSDEFAVTLDRYRLATFGSMPPPPVTMPSSIAARVAAPLMLPATSWIRSPASRPSWAALLANSSTCWATFLA
jgi:hypothetical protein